MSFNQELSIQGRRIGRGQPAFIIAEAGVNHNGSLEAAFSLVDAAADSGADAVKFQSFRADHLVTESAPKAAYQTKGTPAGESQHQMLRALELTVDDHKALIKHCETRRILFLSSPFDEISADLLFELGVGAFKVPSGEITNADFLAFLARKGRPLIVSTGMSTLGEVESAVATLSESGCSDLVLLHCVSNYPARPKDVNLRAMETLARAFRSPVGYSDHTIGAEISIAATALGACVLEKHLTLDRSLPGPDHAASMEPSQFGALVSAVRAVESALGDGRKIPAESEKDTADVARRSLTLKQDVAGGTVLTESMIVSRRPGTGLPPAMKRYLIGRSIKTDQGAGTVLSLEMLS